MSSDLVERAVRAEPDPWALMPKRFRGRTLDGYVPGTPGQRAALAAARRLAAGEIRCLVLAGPTGTGKTHLAIAAIAERFAREHAAWLAATVSADDLPAGLPPSLRPKRIPEPWVPDCQGIPELIVGLRVDMDRERDERHWAERLDELGDRRSAVLLDDLGREKVSDWTGEAIYTLVNARYERELPTVVTTNLATADLAASPYWPAISRLAEDGMLVRLDGEDHRLPRAKR